MRRRWIWLVGAVPAIVTLTLALLLQSERLSNPLLYFEIDLGTLLFLLGLLLSGAILGITALWIWAQRRLEQRVTEEREQAAEARQRFIRSLKHELGNPLTVIRTGLSSLANTSLDARQQESLGRMQTQARHLGELSEKLYQLVVLEKRPLEQEEVDMCRLLDEAVEVARQKPAADERQLNLNIPRAWPLPKVTGDQDLLFLAISNLLDNALKFTRSDDVVDVWASEGRATVVVEVADTGAGVPAAELPYIFEELYRAENARGLEGSGLGLALVKMVVERHGGTIDVHSQEGKGTKFTLRLPVD
jgi:two-component system OmpR family sensor kinase